ncbi:MAG TPA: glycosyltransferase [Steroidobacteraceae bacterium]|nr:glycosyltransferase [Steroidobacteraceae bacterium]
MTGGSAARFLFLTYNPDAPSFRYRLAPVIAELRARGHECATVRLPSGHYGRRLWAVRDALQAADVVMLAKVNLTPPEPRLLRRWARRLAFDFDDSIYLRRPRTLGSPPGDSRWRRFKFASTCRAMDLVIAGNETLAAVARPHAARVTVVPTPVDVSRYGLSAPDADRAPTVVWIGRPENLDYLELIRPALARLSSRWPSLQLRVICSSFPDWHDVRIDRVAWSPESEVQGLMTADIGVMPLTDDEWTRGKCAFKLLQYSAAALPCVATDIGANREAVIDGVTGYLARSPQDWERALAGLLESAERRVQFGLAGRAHIESRFDAKVVSGLTAKLLLDLAQPA